MPHGPYGPYEPHGPHEPLIPEGLLTFTRACRLMGTDEHYVRKWLREEGIAPTYAIDRRLRLYARDQLAAVAAKHGRRLHDEPDMSHTSHTSRASEASETPDISGESGAGSLDPLAILATLAERVAALEAEVARLRDERLVATVLGDSREHPRTPATPGTRVPALPALPDFPPLDPLPPLSLPLSLPPLPASLGPLPRGAVPTRPLRRFSARDQLTAAGLISMETWARHHHVTASTIKKAIIAERQPVTRGLWKQGRALVQMAFDQEQQHEAWRNWHYLPHFTPCADCPHTPELPELPELPAPPDA